MLRLQDALNFSLEQFKAVMIKYANNVLLLKHVKSMHETTCTFVHTLLLDHGKHVANTHAPGYLWTC